MSVLEGLADRLRRHSVIGFVADGQSLRRLHVLVAGFYLYLASVGLRAMIEYWTIADRQAVDVLWPLRWATGLPWRATAIGVVTLFLVASLVAAVAHRHRWARLAVFVGLLLYAAAANSFGKINHGLHHLLIAAFFLALIPPLRSRGEDVVDGGGEAAYRWVFVAQAVVLLTYTLSGLWKLRAGLLQLANGQSGLFSTRSLAAIVADNGLQIFQRPPLADLIVGNPEVSSLLFLGTVAVEITAIAAVLVPWLAAVWAVVLAGFHIVVFWSMHINFTHSVPVLLVLFLLSPFLRVAGRGRGERTGTG